MIARTDAAHRHLSQQFHAHSIHRVYLALVAGAVARGGLVDAALGRDRRDARRVSPRSDAARRAVTEYRVAERLGPGATLLEVRPRTGRMHQIRVHLASIGHPVLGDATYGAPSADHDLAGPCCTQRRWASSIPSRAATRSSGPRCRPIWRAPSRAGAPPSPSPRRELRRSPTGARAARRRGVRAGIAGGSGTACSRPADRDAEALAAGRRQPEIAPPSRRGRSRARRACPTAPSAWSSCHTRMSRTPYQPGSTSVRMAEATGR